MNFSTAYQYMLQGYKIRLRTWPENSWWEIPGGSCDVMWTLDGVCQGIPNLDKFTLLNVVMDNWEVIM